MKDLIKNSLNKVRKDSVLYDEYRLPAIHLRTGGDEFKDDEYFFTSAQKEGRRLVDFFGINEETSVLDIGCGFGRLPIGLQSLFNDITYQGVDVNPVAVDWCKKYISASNNKFSFLRLDIQNERYNPQGQKLVGEFTFPFEDTSFDVIYLYSVFSHMRSYDISIYLNEIYRVLTDNGKVFFTAFIEEDVADEMTNPVGYGDVEWEDSLHCVRFSHDFFFQLISKSGLYVDELVHGKETNGQSALYLSKK